MTNKSILRKRYFNLRKKKYYEIDKEFFFPLINFIKSNFTNENLKLALYYPASFEINVLKILENQYMNNKSILLPVIEKKNKMNFYSWKKNHVLLVNKFGILEPQKTRFKIPNLILLPILAFDGNKYRLGYGKGFYDRFLNKYLKKISNILTVGVAFSFQKHHRLPVNNNDVKLDHILTEKGFH